MQPTIFPQAPIASPFHAASTAADVMAGICMDGKHAIVTGGYSGLGLEMARSLARAGAQVTVPARDLARARQALDDEPNVVVDTMDLADPASIEAFAGRCLAMRRPLHLLINSAGVMATPFARDPHGVEWQFAVNHLGHFRLTAALWPALLEAGDARVVSMSSRGHQLAPVDFDDVSFVRRPYDKWIAYGQSKTANALFAVGLDRRGRVAGVRAFSVHPGSVLGPLARHLTPEEIAAFGVHDADGGLVVAPERDLKTPAQGAATALWCATSPLLQGVGGLYCEDCNIARLAEDGDTGRSGVRPWATDPVQAERLWALSEQLAGKSEARPLT